MRRMGFMRYGEGADPVPFYLQADPAAVVEPTVPDSYAPYNPDSALAPADGSVPYYLAPNATSFVEQYKWWLIGGGIAAAVLVGGGSILGFSMRSKKRSRR